MNDQLPPIDRDLRAHLARRSAGRLPEGLASQVLQAVDRAPVAPRRSWLAFSPRPTAAPRTLLAGGSLAAVLLLVAAFVVVPRFQVTPAASGPAGYPADRALTTAELASVMAGPALPANTALVANVVIDIRSDVCPMDRYPTVGVVDATSSQVCVMAADLSAVPPGHAASGTFAFRYLAPGYLGLLGEITPASSAEVAFRVVDDWPLQGNTFLVDGWLGAEGLVYPCASVTAGDVLSPNGEDCPNDNWLSDDPSAPLIDTSVSVGPQSTRDATKLYGNARIVEAGGMRQIDSIDHGTPVHGVYVVRSVTEQCPGALPQDSRGCSAWRVLAKVAEISVPAPSGTPLGASTAAPTTAPPATPLATSLTGVIGTGNHPLNVDELETLMVNRPDHLAGRIVIVAAPIPTQISCQSDTNGGGCAVNTRPLAQTGIWAVSIGAEGALSLVGQITTPIAGGYVFTLDEVNAATSLKDGELVIVDGWLVEHVVTCDYGPPLPSACGPFSEIASTASDNSPASMYVQQGAFEEFTGSAGDWTIAGPPVHGLFLVRVSNANGGTLVARMEAVTP
jgi:hypothetical protein